MSKDELRALNKNYAAAYGFHDSEHFAKQLGQGLSREVIEEISRDKNEPAWMREFRLHSFETFKKKTLPAWAPDLSAVNFDEIRYYLKPTGRKANNWDDVPEQIKRTFDKLGIPEAEQKFLGGVTAQYESNAVYNKIREDIAAQGVIFTDTDSALQEHERLLNLWFGKIVPPADNAFAALNSAAWSGGSFVYVPPGVQITIPLQAYFRINAQHSGQFERTLIIADKGARVHYVEGCTSPTYSNAALHAAVVEIVALEDATVRYTTIQNWSPNVFNLVTKRAHAHKNATVEWIDGNLGSKLSMKYPAVHLLGEGAKADIVSVALAGKGQHQDTGAKVLHFAPNTTSNIVSKSVSKSDGRTTFRGLVRVAQGCNGVKAGMRCDSLLLDAAARTESHPVLDVREQDVEVTHEATVGRIGEDQLFYLQSRGLSEHEARSLLVLGFLSPFTKQLPFEYAVELNRLVELEMEGA